MDCNFHGMVSPPLSLDGQINGHSQQLWQPDGLPPQPLWGAEEVNPNFITPENSLLSYDSSGNSGESQILNGAVWMCVLKLII